jgi:hypothetical protein
MSGGRTKVKEPPLQRPVFRIACLKVKDKACRKENLRKEHKSWPSWMKNYKPGG